MAAAAEILLRLLPLTPTEYRVLEALIAAGEAGNDPFWPGGLLKISLARQSWPDWEFTEHDGTGWSHMVEVAVYRVRRKLEANAAEIQQVAGTTWEIQSKGRDWCSYRLRERAAA